MSLLSFSPVSSSCPMLNSFELPLFICFDQSTAIFIQTTPSSLLFFASFPVCLVTYASLLTVQSFEKCIPSAISFVSSHRTKNQMKMKMRNWIKTVGPIPSVILDK